MSHGDPLRWLYYQEFGTDPGQLHPRIAEQLRQHYLTELWNAAPEYVNKLPEPIRQRLAQIQAWATPFLQRNKPNV
jgi:hypothetical protein